MCSSRWLHLNIPPRNSQGPPSTLKALWGTAGSHCSEGSIVFTSAIQWSRETLWPSARSKGETRGQESRWGGATAALGSPLLGAASLSAAARRARRTWEAWPGSGRRGTSAESSACCRQEGKRRQVLYLPRTRGCRPFISKKSLPSKPDCPPPFISPETRISTGAQRHEHLSRPHWNLLCTA